MIRVSRTSHERNVVEVRNLAAVPVILSAPTWLHAVVSLEGVLTYIQVRATLGERVASTPQVLEHALEIFNRRAFIADIGVSDQLDMSRVLKSRSSTVFAWR